METRTTTNQRGDNMKIMTLTVSVPDDTITAERVNHAIICEEIKAAILDCMILDKDDADKMTVYLRSIE
jgi:hypothetical protein